jgi:hypothetical protein
VFCRGASSQCRVGETPGRSDYRNDQARSGFSDIGVPSPAASNSSPAEIPLRRVGGVLFHGVPFSGKPLDAFPSGHAIHVGALASAATVLPPAKRNLAWSIGAGLVLTRIVLLAHWTSDVIAGLAIGTAVEQLLRRWTGFGLSRPE